MLKQDPSISAFRQVLLLCDDPAWLAAAQREVAIRGGILDCAHSATDALYRLVAPSHRFSHLLLEPAAAGPLLRDLVGVTAGEAGSQVELVVLGDRGSLSEDAAVRQARTPGDLGPTLRELPALRARPPTLTTSDIAIGFDAEDVECRFQPIVRLSDHRPVGMETLVRLRREDYGTIGPDQFVPQIERAGLSLRLTEAVAVAALSAIHPALLDQYGLFLSINLPLDVLLFPEAFDRIEAHRHHYAIPAGRILIELTESRPVSDLAGLALALERWRRAGYRVAIDDMGPDMMNQVNLFDLPFTVVKLDKQIVLRSHHDPLARNYLKRTVGNAKSRSLEVIAEGIENQAMWNSMREIGADYAQGFLVARALPATALAVWLQAWSEQLALPPDRI